jgi:hypothetical protein
MVCETLCQLQHVTTLTQLLGMFLWARLVLDYLAGNIFHNRHEITAAIETLPRELSEL